MDDSFEARANAEHPDKDSLDAEAYRFVTSWHRHPQLHDALWYHGVNLGEVDEYVLMQEIVAILVKARREKEK